ncbi:MAG: EthD domain-containing protein, partial [Pseudomonadales bacterium]
RFHGSEAAEQIRKAFPSARGAVQTTACEQQVGEEGNTSFSATLELWFRYAAEAEAAAATSCQVLLSDGAKVAATYTGLERTVMKTPAYAMADCIKGVYPFRRKADMSVADFQDYWWHNHGPLAAQTEGALAYFQVHCTEACYENGSPSYDGITELHYKDPAAALQAVASKQMQEVQAPDAPNFADLASVELLLVEQEVVIPC